MAMILSDAARERTIAIIQQWRDAIAEERLVWKSRGYTPEEVRRLENARGAMIPDLEDQVCLYNGLKAGMIPLVSPEDMGRGLVYCRIASGLTQEQFAEQLKMPVYCRIASGPTEEQFAEQLTIPLATLRRDEENEYFGRTPEDIAYLFRRLGYALRPVTRISFEKIS